MAVAFLDAAPDLATSGAPTNRSKTKGFWARVLESIIAARMQRAEREIARYRDVHKRHEHVLYELASRS